MMLAALGSPVRSPAPLQRHLRSAPNSPLPHSAQRAFSFNQSPASSNISNGSNAPLPASPSTPERAALNAAPLLSPARNFQPLRDGAVSNLFDVLPQLPLLLEEQDQDGPVPMQLDGPAPLPDLGHGDALLGLPLLDPAPIAAAAGARAGAQPPPALPAAALDAAIADFPADPDGLHVPQAAPFLFAIPPVPAPAPAPAFPAPDHALQPEPHQPHQPPPAAAIDLAAAVAPLDAAPPPVNPPPAAPAALVQLQAQQQQLLQVGGQLNHHFHQWQQLVQEVHQHLLNMHQLEQLHQELQELQQEAHAVVHQAAVNQAVQQQAVNQAVQQAQAAQAAAQAAAAVALAAAELQQAVDPAPAVPAADAAAAGAAAAAAVAAAPAPEPVVAQPRVRDAERDLEPGVWVLAQEASEAPQGDGPAAMAADSDKAAGGEPKFSEPAMVFIRSINSNKRTRVLFANESGRHIAAFWVNYEGQEIMYGSLLPGQAKIYDTYVSHPWVFRCAATGERMVVGGRMTHYAEPAPIVQDNGLSLRLRPPRAQPKRVPISVPPPLVHSRETHVAFPADFKAASAALLLAHQRLQRPDLQAAAAAAAEARRTLTDVMCRMFRNAFCSVILVAQPAMQAMGVCTPADTRASPNVDTCKLRWLDGASLGATDDGAEDNDGRAPAPDRLAAAWRASSPQVALAPAAPAAAAAAASDVVTPRSGPHMQAPDTTHMRMRGRSPPQPGAAGANAAAGGSAAAGPAAGGCGDVEMAAADQQPGDDRVHKRGAASPCSLPARSEAQLKAWAEREAEREATRLGQLLAELPRELVHHIIHMMAPPVTQDVALFPRGHPDILPALLPADPATWPPRPVQPQAA